MSITVTGTNELSRKLTAIGNVSTEAAMRAVYKLENDTLGRAVRRAPVGGGPFSPRDPHPGQLRASGLAPFPAVEGMRVTGQVGFGGAASAYAGPQEFRTDFRHSVGQALYLTTSFDEVVPTAGQVIADEVAFSIGKAP